jgi:hypothetical protein
MKSTKRRRVDPANRRWHSAGYQRFPATQTRTQWRRGVWRGTDGRRFAPEADARGPLPGVRKRQRIRSEGAEGAGADRGGGAVGGHGLLVGAVAMLAPAGRCFTAQEPEGVGPEKYDETAAAMIAQLKYGSGTPFYRLEKLEGQLGIPLPAATQWEGCRRGHRVGQTGGCSPLRHSPVAGIRRPRVDGCRVIRLRRPNDRQPFGS